MPEEPRTAENPDQVFLDTLHHRMRQLLDEHAQKARTISTDATVLLDYIADLVSSGKRVRALLAWWGFQGAGGATNDPRIIDAGVALELFQAAALIHDDVVDRSDTRRGAPSVHRRFEGLHRSSGWRQDSEHFGVAAAILTGDLALALSEEVFAAAADATAFASTAREAFNTMRFEVMVGQYLDLHGEVDVDNVSPQDARQRARTVVRFKSAHYSVVWPLALGAVLAGADENTQTALDAFSRPLGIAFQLQDDLLGVFGDPALTGKPAGDDLREGKRTELVAIALQHLDDVGAARLNSALGDPELGDDDVAELQQLLTESGARAAISAEVEELGTTALAGLDQLPVDDHVRKGLRQLTRRVLLRTN